LLFRLLVVAEGFAPNLSSKRLDPRAGTVNVTLKQHDLDQRDPALVFRGRVLDDHGNPVPRALVEPVGLKKGDATTFGTLRGVDALAITNAQGEFRLGVPEAGVALHLRVKARALATYASEALPAGPAIHALRLDPGVSVVGKVLYNDKPLGGIALGLVQQHRWAEQFVGSSEISTDKEGRFAFVNIPAKEAYFVYGLIESCRPYGAIPVRPIQVGASGTVVDVGPLELEPGHTLSGRLILADGKPVPPGTPVSLSRGQAWDYQVIRVGADARFSFSGLPTETYSLSAKVPGYYPSPKNFSLDALNGFSLVGRITRTTQGLRFLLEPSAKPLVNSNKRSNEDFREYERRRAAELKGTP
jgi:hypothetical protein